MSMEMPAGFDAWLTTDDALEGEEYEYDPSEMPALRVGQHTNWIPSLIDGWHPGMETQRVFSTNRTSPLIPDLAQLIGREFHITIPKQPTEEEVQEMAWTNPEARDIAREILTEKKREALRGEVTAAVATLTEMVADAKCGSVFTFRKTNEDNGKHYWYAAIKNGDKWFTTAQNPRQLDSDEAFIEWLITLEAWKSEGLELTQGSIPEHAMLEATATDTSPAAEA